MMYLIILILSFVLIRVLQVYFFLKKVSKVCNSYDWKYIKKHNEAFADMVLDDSYYVKCEWSAYNFLFLKGPSHIDMFFSTKPLTLEGQYNKHQVDKLRTYDIV